MRNFSQSAPHASPIPSVLDALGARATGLTSEESAARRARVGPNELPPPRRVSALSIFVAQLRGVVVLLLIAATAISAAIGEPLEAAAIAAVLAINTTLGFATELRARRAMERVLRLEVPRAWVLRDGLLGVVEARDLVPGDVVELGTGRQVPADARLLDAADLRIDEAALTGESLPTSKRATATLDVDTPLADRVTMVYKGTTVMAGLGRACVTATGVDTEVGRIGTLVSSVEMVPTPLERRLDALGGRLAWVAIGAGAGVSALDAAQGAPLAMVVQTGIALAIAAVPEALPAVATIALAVGMRRMAARCALVRRLPAVESLGSTTVICTDKTRTLTSGQMTVVEVRGLDRARVLAIAARASRPQAHAGAATAVQRDPVDAAMLDASARDGIEDAGERHEIGLMPFSSDRKLMAVFHRVNGRIVASVKGAPRQVLTLCDGADVHAVMEMNDAMARNGLRVLAVAEGPVPDTSEEALRGLTFAGLVGLADPAAPGVKEAIARLNAAGLRTLMLTGDQHLTAEAVGRDLGIPAANIFSRITPEDKLRIVRDLQGRGEIVAMLGDGVNDAPALKQADVGVAMGGRGTDAAKAAAAIVLQDDRFETIAAAVEEGRVIFDNIRKFVLYLFSCNVAEVFVLLIAGAAGLPLPLLPLQILWLNMVTDTFPALALAMEPGDPDVMRRAPRQPDEAVLSRPFIMSIVLYGGLITASTLTAYVWALGRAPAQAASVAFMTLAFAQIFHLGNARSADPVVHPRRALANVYALGGATLAAALQLAAAYVPPLARILGVAWLDANAWLVVVVFAAVPAVAGQLLKRWRPHL
jgi:P-type Ca2+ transporter type 2C